MKKRDFIPIYRCMIKLTLSPKGMGEDRRGCVYYVFMLGDGIGQNWSEHATIYVSPKGENLHHMVMQSHKYTLFGDHFSHTRVDVSLI